MIPAPLLACASNVAPTTLEAIVSVESGGNPFAVNVNGLRVQPPPAHDAREAAQLAARYIARGYSVDLGLMQVNSRNLAALGLTVQEVLDPCTNIRSGAAILTTDYAEAARARGAGQPALQAALSAYNTGDFHRGFANGYVAQYYRPGGIPALAGGEHGGVASVTAAWRVPTPPPPNPYTADTRVFVRETAHVEIE
ncbi:lytic transglycosylase domain-containing protein [Limobrevibacterium gyesilva]|uniref:Lytic transglycosylase domain-containing protein n=1 Tax=Limobrevibacterium gyesilva TaxID=2991712 RepID=A0AA42CEM9_9PROT|nr:lytic transglycosylase domain-containing protein [Limobrevibacterium gyesilva]MCW3476238.1 lytic transglycosylase domain-containing protein [Limobrevibacterium gyesilva]